MFRLSHTRKDLTGCILDTTGGVTGYRGGIRSNRRKEEKGNGNQRVNLKRALVVNHEDQNQKKTKLEKKEETLLSKENKRHLCATKGDDEEVQTKLWEEFLLRGAIPVRKEADLEKGLKPIRNWLLQYWKRKVTCSFIRWLWSREDQKKAWNSGRLRQLNTIGLLLDTKPESAVSAVVEAVCVSPKYGC